VPPAPGIADLIDRATRVTPEYDRPLFDRRISNTNRVFDQVDDDKGVIWDAAFDADPNAAMPQLLQNLAVGGQSFIPTRAVRLAALPEDPRLGTRLVELVPSGPGRYPLQPKYWAPMIEIWSRARDLRTCTALLELADLIVGAKGAAPMLRFAGEPTLNKYPGFAEADRPMLAAIENELLRLDEPTRLGVTWSRRSLRIGDVAASGSMPISSRAGHLRGSTSRSPSRKHMPR
jgi:hypothetical protein